MNWLEIHRGQAPLIVSLPHTGTDLPEMGERLVSTGHALRDTDWYIHQLYDFAARLDATILRTRISRTVVDVNRDPGGASLYPGMATTELCPTTTFDGEPLYKPGHAPDDAEIARRRDMYHVPYHQALTAEVERQRKSGVVVVYDCHSIRSRVPRLFEGELPQFNIGTNDGRSCDLRLAQSVRSICLSTGLSTVLNGRFKGGYITRSMGKPDAGVHALQMELAIRGYMTEPATEDAPPTFDPVRAAPMREVLERVLTACIEFARGK